MRILLPFLRPYRREIILGPAFKLTEAILELILPLIMARIIDVAIPAGDRGLTLRLALLILLLSVAGMGCAFVCQYFASLASQGVGTDLRNALFNRILTFGPGEVERFGAQSLVNRLGGDINQLQLAVAMLIRLVVRAPFLSIGGLIMAMLIDLRLSLIFMAVIPLFVISLYLVMSRSVPLYRSIQARLDTVARVLRENLGGVRVIRAYARTDAENTRFGAANQTLADTALRVGRIASLLNPVTTLILNAGAIAILYFGAGRINTGDLSRGEIIAFLNYLAQILVAMMVVANLVVLYTRAFASAQRVSAVLATEPALADIPDAAAGSPDAAAGASDTAVSASNAAVSASDAAVCASDAAGGQPAAVAGDVPALAFEQVRFAYTRQADPVFDGLDIEIKAGERIGIIGATGSGKSTLATLALRQHEVDGGRVRVFGQDVRSIPTSVLRRWIGLAPQKALLMTGTLAENLRMGNPDATDDQLRQALYTAAADDFFAELPQGLAAPVSRSGQNFSGGQRQRLSVARTIAADPRILILDDTFSALDYLTEAKMRQRLMDLAPAKTLILISQRVSSIRACDRILVLDDGRPVGFDSHDRLLAESPVYQDICRTQLPEMMPHEN